MALPPPQQEEASGPRRCPFLPTPELPPWWASGWRKWLSNGPAGFSPLCLAPGSFSPAKAFGWSPGSATMNLAIPGTLESQEPTCASEKGLCVERGQPDRSFSHVMPFQPLATALGAGKAHVICIFINEQMKQRSYELSPRWG